MTLNRTDIHYAFQSCDIRSYQNAKRFCGDDRTELSKKSLKSFLQSVLFCAEKNPNIFHNILIVDDESSNELKSFYRECQIQFSNEKIFIDIFEMEKKSSTSFTHQSYRNSLEKCYHWLQNSGKDLVYQIQDDYIFLESAIFEMVDLFFQIKKETGSECIISPYNDSWNWLALYRNKATPRVVVVGKKRYWIQYYDMSCTFMTSHNIFKDHWDLYYAFFELMLKKVAGMMENRSLNYILSRRGVLGLVPLSSLAFHMQTDLDKDPHIDWKPLWDSIKI